MNDGSADNLQEHLAATNDLNELKSLIMQLHAQGAQQQADQQAFTQAAVAAALDTAKVSSAHRGKIAKFNKPDEFKGERKHLPTFLAKMQLCFDAEPSSFPDELSKIVYAVTYLKDDAYRWVIPWQRMGLLSAFIDYPGFERKLRTAFGDPDELATAERELNGLRQKGPCSEYTVEFLRITSILTDWGEEALRSHYRLGLSDDIKDQLIHVEYGQTLSSLIDKAQAIDSRLAARRLGREQERSMHAPKRPAVNHKFPNRRFDRAATVDISVPMEIDNTNTRSAPLTEVRKLSNIKEGRCFGCNEIGHIRRDCPKREAKN